MSLIVTGASGQLGRLVTEELLTRVDPSDVVLVTRKPDALDGRGAEVRYGDFDDPASLAEAFAGGTRLLLISTDSVGTRLAGHKNAIDAAVGAGVTHIAYTGWPNPVAESPSPVAGDHRATEGMIRDAGAGFTFLRNAQYADMLDGEARGAIATGTLVHNRGTGAHAYVTRADCAAAAAGVLAEGDAHVGQIYDVTGPELLDASALATIYATLGATEVEAVAVDDAGYVEAMVAAGLPEPVAGFLAGFGAATREGFNDQQTDAVERLSGRPATTVKDVLARALAAA